MDVKLFCGSKSKYLAEKIADHYGYALGDQTLANFSDGEMQPIINESVAWELCFFYPIHFCSCG